MEKRDLLWALYISEREFIQHHENQRTHASNILGAIAAGVMIALGTEALSPVVQVALSLTLVVIGAFGWIFCAKLYALIKLHAERSYEYLKVLDEEVAAVQIKEMKARASAKNKADFKWLSKIGLNRIWSRFHLVIFLFGLFFTVQNVLALVGVA
ncbi:MAG: hypothetical protein AAFR93_06860 [Pseudomonadota bacterium]